MNADETLAAAKRVQCAVQGHLPPHLWDRAAPWIYYGLCMRCNEVISAPLPNTANNNYNTHDQDRHA